MTDQLLIMPAIFIGLIIGIYEILIIHRDVQIPIHRFMHGIHALVIAVVAVFASMNVPFVLTIIPALANIPIIGSTLGFQIIIGLIMAVKIHAVSRAIPATSGVALPHIGETWFHSIFIGALTVGAPYIWPFIAPALPEWITK